MEDRKPIAEKYGEATLIYGVTAFLMLLCAVFMVVEIVSKGGIYGILVIGVLFFLAVGGFFAYLAVKVALMPEVLIVEAEGGIWIMSRRPPLFIPAAEIRGVLVVRERMLTLTRTAAPIAIRTTEGEISIHAVAEVDAVHDRIVAIMSEAAKKSV
ncbi:MAG: hypothetical protein WC509_05935 [Candidatus Izemoplasmatales bacterium]